MEQATKTPQQLTAQFQTNVRLLDDILGVSRNYDISAANFALAADGRTFIFWMDTERTM